MSDGQIPYGAEIPTPPEEDVAPDKEVDVPAKQEPQQEPDWKKNYDELRSTFNKRDGEMKTLREESKALRDELASMREQSKKAVEQARNQDPPTDYEKMLRDVAAKYENGDISYEQSLLESNRITREMTKAENEAEKRAILEQTNQAWQQELSRRDGQAVANKFYQDNPDFQSLDETGELDKVMSENPLMDKLSAYYKLQADKAKDFAAQEFERGKQESARIAQGSAPAAKVLQDPGTSMQQQRQPKPTGEAAIKESMAKALAGLNA